MHLLLTNDDGPLDQNASPYVKHFVDYIHNHTDWELTIVVPHVQRSWIGKAHFAGKDLTPTYIYTVPNSPDNSFDGPYKVPQTKPGTVEWILLDGTPASCADIGVHHLAKKPVDLVISGPNVGRNSTAVYITSSGTVGAAMEAALAGSKAIGLSWAFAKERYTPPETLDAAAELSFKVVEYLYNNWNPEADLYTVNVPLFGDLGVGKTPVVYAPILANKWETSVFAKEDTSDGEIVDGSESPMKFRWKPDFKSVHDGVARSEGISDGKVVDSGAVSNTSQDTENKVVLSINPETYIYEPLKSALQKHIGLPIDSVLPEKFTKLFQYAEYEDIDHELLNANQNYVANAYIYRKALIRKHYLSHTIHSYVVKHPESILARSWLDSYNLEVDYAEFLDDSLDECWELRQQLEEEDEGKWWILKPSMSDKGQGIRVFQTVEELQAIFDSFEEDPTDDEYDDEGDSAAPSGSYMDNNVITSQLRHFIVQQYMQNPLLVDNKKFHLRVYVLAKGDIQVFVYDRMLALFASDKYEEPAIGEDGFVKLDGHLTNTCLQADKTNAVDEFDNLELSAEAKATIKEQIRAISGEIFKAAVSVDKMNFQPLYNAFEVYGFDYIVDSDLNVKLLEINAFPDFKQTGDELKDLIWELFDGVVATCVAPHFGKPAIESKLVPVLDINVNNW